MSINGREWPKGVRAIDFDNLNRLGYDDKGALYWDGSPIVTSPFASLTRGEKIIAIVLAISAVIAALGSAVQGATAYENWACSVRSSRLTICPPEVPSSQPAPHS